MLPRHNDWLLQSLATSLPGASICHRLTSIGSSCGPLGGRSSAVGGGGASRIGWGGGRERSTSTPARSLPIFYRCFPERTVVSLSCSPTTYPPAEPAPYCTVGGRGRQSACRLG